MYVMVLQQTWPVLKVVGEDRFIQVSFSWRLSWVIRRFKRATCRILIFCKIALVIFSSLLEVVAPIQDLVFEYLKIFYSALS